MDIDKIIQNIDELEFRAREINVQIHDLIFKSEIEDNPPSQILIAAGGEIPTLDGIEYTPPTYFSEPAKNKWKAIPPKTRAQQKLLIDNYLKWYNDSLALVHEFASFREEEFKQYNEKSSSHYGILTTIKLENVFTGNISKQTILDSIINDFNAQQKIVSAIKVTLVIRKPKESANNPRSILEFLQSRVRSAVFKKPDYEKDIQVVVDQLLIGRGLNKGDDYDREVGRVKNSSKEFIPDFIFPKLGLALEIKLFKNSTQKSKLIDEINADINAYSKTYAILAFLIYDLGNIRNEIEFRQGLENNENIFIIIVKH